MITLIGIKILTLDDLKRLAGITEFKGYEPYGGSNISITGMEKRRIEKEKNIKPGDPEWFKLWFSLPYLTNLLQFKAEKKINLVNW
jgi:hypothetical protein